MVLEFEQVKSNGRDNVYILTGDNGSHYKYMLCHDIIDMPIVNQGDFKGIKAFNDKGDLEYRIKFNIFKNTLADLTSIKHFIPSINAQSDMGEIVDKNDEVIGSIINYKKSPLNTYHILNINNNTIIARMIETGNAKRWILLNEHDEQIGEILVPHIYKNNKITSKIFILSSIKIDPIFLGLLMTYFDKGRARGRFFMGTEIKYGKSYSKANFYFNKDWIPTHFSNYVLSHPELSEYFSTKLKKSGKIILFTSIGILILFFGVIYLMYNLGI